MQSLNHLHILVTAIGLTHPPKSANVVAKWLEDLVWIVSMETLMGPYAIRCEDLGNEGVTGIVVISTSHASLHCWDTGCDPFLRMDLYSCKQFDPLAVVAHLRKFGPKSVEFMIIDRNQGMRVIDRHTLHFDDFNNVKVVSHQDPISPRPGI